MNDTSATFNNQVNRWRAVIFGAALVVVFAIYIGRLYTLQIIEGPQWLAKADDNRTASINIPAPRGVITDRNGIVLARNIPSYNVVIVPAELPDDLSQTIWYDDIYPAETEHIFRALAELIDMPVHQGNLEETLFVPCETDLGIYEIALYGATTSPFEPVRVKCDVDEAIARIIQEKSVDWPGVQIEVSPLRDYPTGELTANIIGYLGPIGPENEAFYTERGFQANRDKVGYAGIESYFQDELAGRNGRREVEVDVGGQVLRDLEPPVAPQPGDNIRLTIDIRLQQAAHSILIDEMQDWNNIVTPDNIQTSGVVIAMNPQTGEILAMVSYPTYENNRLSRLIPAYYWQQLTEDLRLPLLNHATGDELNVGSVFKLVTATGALNEGVVTLDSIVKTPGVITMQEKFFENDVGKERLFVDWVYKNGENPAGFGQLDILHCIAYSSNVCFYKLGGGFEDEIPEGLGICRLGSYARALGYDTNPGIELPDVANGLIPDPRWKRINQGQSWSTGDTYIASVGQGFIVGTPLQVLMSAATVSTGGKLMEPTLLYEMTDSENKLTQPFTPNMRWDLTVDPKIEVYSGISALGCETTGELKTIEPWVFDTVRQGMRMAVAEDGGTLADKDDTKKIGFDKLAEIGVAAAGKTGTAEYCDIFAFNKGRCEFGKWPSHAWTVAFAPYENPEIAVIAFVYNGGEGASTAAPIVRLVMQAYFELKAVDSALAAP